MNNVEKQPSLPHFEHHSRKHSPINNFTSLIDNSMAEQLRKPGHHEASMAKHKKNFSVNAKYEKSALTNKHQ